MPSRPALILCMVFSATVLRSACADEPTPDIEWTVVDEGERPGLSDPCYSDGLVIVGNDAGALRAFNAATGADVWRFEVDGPPKAIYSKPLLMGDTVSFAAGDGKVYAVDRATGAMRWKLVPVEGAELYSSPASDGRRIFVTSRPTQAKTGQAALVAIDPYFGQ